MTRIRIRCRAPAPVTHEGFALGRLPDWQDLEVFAVAPDGTETPLTNVDRVEFVAQASAEPLRVVVTLLNPEIDVEGEMGDPVIGGPPLAYAPDGQCLGIAMDAPSSGTWTPSDGAARIGVEEPEAAEARRVAVEDMVGIFTADTFEALAERGRMVFVDPAFVESLRDARAADAGNVADTMTETAPSDYGRLCDELAQAVLRQVRL